MSASSRVTELESRKRLLIAEADLHRRTLMLEKAAFDGRCRTAADLVGRNRWWLLPALALGGWFVGREWRNALTWLPRIFATWRAVRGETDNG